MSSRGRGGEGEVEENVGGLRRKQNGGIGDVLLEYTFLFRHIYYENV